MPGSCSASELTVLTLNQQNSVNRPGKDGIHRTIDQINQIFLLPHSVALESYVKAFQYKVINSICYTNTKLCEIGYRSNDLCTFCKTESEISNHFF